MTPFEPPGAPFCVLLHPLVQDEESAPFGLEFRKIHGLGELGPLVQPLVERLLVDDPNITLGSLEADPDILHDQVHRLFGVRRRLPHLTLRSILECSFW